MSRIKLFSPLAFILCQLIFLNPAQANLPSCTAHSAKGETCWTPIATIHPTQIPIGRIEVSQKEKLIRTLLNDPKKLAKFQKNNPAPAVLSPDGRIYIIDHHHLILGFQLSGIEDALVEIRENFKDLTSQDSFWQEMSHREWVYRYDEKGLGPVPFSQIPDRLEDLKDDPYRSLASATRNIHGYRKVEIPFTEFIWANFFRPRIKIGNTQADFDQAVHQAYKFARSKKAKGLPGYIGPKDLR